MICLIIALFLILEKLFAKRLSSFLTKYGVISNPHYDFKANTSKIQALADASNYITSNLDKGHFTIGFFIDLRKALDMVDHNILLNKMEFYGVSGDFLKS